MKTTRENDPEVSGKRLFAVLRRPIFFTIINFFFLNTIFAFLPYGLGEIVYTAARVVIIGYAGWLVQRKGLGGARRAALVGAGIYFIDHVVLKGGVFILNYLFKPDGMGLAAFSSIVVSFLLIAPAALVIGAAGGAVAARQRRRLETGSSTDGTRD